MFCFVGDGMIGEWLVRRVAARAGRTQRGRKRAESLARSAPPSPGACGGARCESCRTQRGTGPLLAGWCSGREFDAIAVRVEHHAFVIPVARATWAVEDGVAICAELLREFVDALLGAQ